MIDWVGIVGWRERERIDGEFVANAKQKLKIEMRSSPSHLRDQAAAAAVGS